MLTIKDIKISRTRIPLQNAIWLRPIGGLQFKLYYPHGGDWAELNLNSSSGSGDSESGKVTPTPKQVIVGKSSWDSMKVIACKCIPMKARIGAKYYFADGRIKFNAINGTKRHIFTYVPTDDKLRMVFTSIDFIPLLRKNNFNPLLVTIKSKDDYDADWERVQKEYGPDADTSYMQIEKFETLHKGELVTVYYRRSFPRNLSCDTTSPYFKIINGHIRNVKPARMPIIYRNPFSVENERKHFRCRSPKPQKLRATKDYKLVNYAARSLPNNTILMNFRKAWRRSILAVDLVNDFLDTSRKKRINNFRKKIFKIWEIKKNRFSQPRIVRWRMVKRPKYYGSSENGNNIIYEPFNWV